MGMFDTPKAFASLSSGLLARKGAAKPAMRPQGFGQMGASLEDLGWNDMGFEAPKPAVSAQERDADHDAFGESFAEAPLRNPVAALTPSPGHGAATHGSPVHDQQAELAEQYARAASSDEVDEVTAAELEGEDDTAPFAPLAEVLRVAEAEITVAADTSDGEADAEPRAAVLSLKPRTEAASVPVLTTPVLTLAPRVVQPRTERAAGAKAAFTLRLDAARHLRLRLACALTGRSAQMLVTEAVDKLLADYPELDTFAGQLPEGGRSLRAKG